MTNQEKERYYFERFCRVYNLPEGQVQYGDKPDIIIEGQQKIGIEVTNLYLKDGKLLDSEQSQSVIRAHVIREAQKKFLEQGEKPFEISFSFNSEKPIEAERKRILISELVKLATQVTDLPEGEVARSVYQEIPELSLVYVNPMLPNPEWRIIRASTVQAMSLQRLMDVVKTKEKKAKQYTPCDCFWLLVVVDFINPAQDQEIRIDNIKLQSSVFEKIIIYKTALEHVVEITNEGATS